MIEQGGWQTKELDVNPAIDHPYKFIRFRWANADFTKYPAIKNDGFYNNQMPEAGNIRYFNPLLNIHTIYVSTDEADWFSFSCKMEREIDNQGKWNGWWRLDKALGKDRQFKLVIGEWQEVRKNDQYNHNIVFSREGLFNYLLKSREFTRHQHSAVFDLIQHLGTLMVSLTELGRNKEYSIIEQWINVYIRKLIAKEMELNPGKQLWELNIILQEVIEARYGALLNYSTCQMSPEIKKRLSDQGRLSVAYPGAVPLEFNVDLGEVSTRCVLARSSRPGASNIKREHVNQRLSKADFLYDLYRAQASKRICQLNIYGLEIAIVTNLFPIGPHHIQIICVDSKRQSLFYEFDLVVETISKWLPDYVFFFNSRGARASSFSLHSQGFKLKEGFHIQHSKTAASKISNIKLTQKYPLTAFVLAEINIHQRSLFSADLIGLLDLNDCPYNVIFGGLAQKFIVPRNQVTPGKLGETFASVEIGGTYVVTVTDLFSTAYARQIGMTYDDFLVLSETEKNSFILKAFQSIKREEILAALKAYDIGDELREFLLRQYGCIHDLRRVLSERGNIEIDDILAQIKTITENRNFNIHTHPEFIMFMVMIGLS